MSYDSLAEFLSALQDHGELVQIPVPVDPALELAAITDRVAKGSSGGGPALLFENVKNSTFPVVTNLLGSRRRLSLCLGVTDLDELAAELDRRLQSQNPGGWLDALKLTSDWGGLGKWLPKLVKSGICQQVVRLGRDVNLWDLPVPRCWPGEPYPVITAGIISTLPPGTPNQVHFRAPLVVTGQSELAWYDGDHNQRMLLDALIASNQNLPVAISLGGDPTLTLAVGMPEITDPRLFAGLIRGSNTEVVRCRTNDVEVPASAEVIIEGYVDAANPRSNGPITVARENGRYVQREMPVIQVTAITHRANPILPASIVSRPPSEESWISLAGERIMLPLLRRRFPELIDIHRPFSGSSRNLLFVRIRKTKSFQARRILHAIWGMEWLGQSKLIVVVDEDIDVQNEDLVWYTVGNCACPNRDFVFSDGLASDDDYTSTETMRSGRVGIDATRKDDRESAGNWPQSLIMSDDILERLHKRWSEFGLDV